jgi:nicotinate-nucleotide pyrophosphorylase (carboxylating)
MPLLKMLATATIPHYQPFLTGTIGKAKLLIKDTGILAGVELALEIFHEVDAKDLKVNVFLQDGAEVKPGDIALEVEGSVHSILIAERLST